MSPSAGALTPETRVGLFKIADTGKSLAGLRRTHDMTLHDGHPHSPPSIIHRHEDMRRCFFFARSRQWPWDSSASSAQYIFFSCWSFSKLMCGSRYSTTVSPRAPIHLRPRYQYTAHHSSTKQQLSTAPKPAATPPSSLWSPFVRRR